MWDEDDDPYDGRNRAAQSRVIYLEPEPYRGPKTSRTEILDLTAAIVVLTIIFAMPFGGVAIISGLKADTIGLLFLSAFVAVLASIVVHELAHKFLAQKYGCWAEFRKSGFWLMLGLVASLGGFSFIAPPGAVMIAGRVSTQENGKISAIGPFSNAVMGFLFFPLAMVFPSNSIIGFMLIRIVAVNALLGAFNMLPIYPIDGSKVVRWSIGAYAGLLGLLVFLIVLAQIQFRILGF